QYEGHNYWGLGVLLLLCFSLPQSLPILRERRDTRLLVFSAGMVLLTLFALSNQVYAGHRLLLSYRLPKVLAVLAGQFRSSGRFFWPVTYSVMAFAIAKAFRLKPSWLGVGLAIAALALQTADLGPERRLLRDGAAGYPAAHRLQDSRWRSIIAAHNLVVL